MKKDSVKQVSDSSSLQKSTNSGKKREDVLRVHSPTVTKEKIVTENTQIKFFDNENDCREYIKSHPELYVFSEDINAYFSKLYIASDRKTISKLSQMKKFCLYEYFDRDELVKLYLDIDIKQKEIPKDADRKSYFKQIINQSLNLIVKHLEPYGVKNPKMIVFAANREEKLSAHVIFIDVVFDDVYAIKAFMMNIKSPLIDKKILDLSVYKKGCLRLPWNSKYGIWVNFDVHKFINCNYDDDDNEKLFMDCMVTNIPENYIKIKLDIPKVVKIKRKQVPNGNAKNIQGLNIKESSFTKIPISTLQPLVDILSDERADDYATWLQVGMCLHNCNPTEASFNIFDKWSQKSNSYVSRQINAMKWNSFSFGHYSLGTLKYLAKKDNPDKYAEIEYATEKRTFETIDFQSNYILNQQDEIISEKKSFICPYVLQWINDPLIKILAMFAGYNNGKTQFVYNLIDQFPQFKRVLFISYRQTLTNDLYGNFKRLNVKSYLDGFFEEDRIICQIESLYKILGDYQFNDAVQVIASFDLVVLDEIESDLAHFTSSTIKNKKFAFELMRNILYNSKKILALDGDFHNRAYQYVNSFGKSIVLHNTIIKDIKKFIFTNNRILFENKVFNDLKNGLNVALICMSSTLAMYYYNELHKTYKAILHCAKNDDELKKLLKKINKLWILYQLVIYSPSIEAGVNFNVKHFHKIYVILSPNSTSQRGLLQMCSRIRTVEDNNIMVYLNNLPYKEQANLYTFDEVKEYVCDMYQDYFDYKMVHDPEIDKMVIKYEYGLYEQILIHNQTEIANKTKNLFVPGLIQLLKQKGHSYEYISGGRNKDAPDKTTILKDEIMEAVDINYEQFNILMNKQKKNTATKEDKVEIEKYLLKKAWKINDVSKAFLDRYYGKTDKLFNLRYFTDPNLIKPFIGNDDGTYYTDWDPIIKLEQVKMIKEVIQKLGYDNPNDGKKIIRKQFIENIKTVLSECKLFTDTAKSQPLFGFTKDKVSKLMSFLNKKSEDKSLEKITKPFLGFMNSLLSDWGMILEWVQIKTCKRSNGIKKNIIINFYSFNYIDQINEFI